MVRSAMRSADVSDHAAVQALARGFTRGSLLETKRWLAVQWNQSAERVLYRVLAGAPGGDRYVYGVPTLKFYIAYHDGRAHVVTVTENSPAVFAEMQQQESAGLLPHEETWQTWYSPHGRYLVTPANIQANLQANHRCLPDTPSLRQSEETPYVGPSQPRESSQSIE